VLPVAVLDSAEKIRLFLSLPGIEIWFLDFDNFSKAIFVVTRNGENRYFPGKIQYLRHDAENFNSHLAEIIKTVDIWIVILTPGTRVYIQLSWLSL